MNFLAAPDVEALKFKSNVHVFVVQFNRMLRDYSVVVPMFTEIFCCGEEGLEKFRIVLFFFDKVAIVAFLHDQAHVFDDLAAWLIALFKQRVDGCLVV